MSERWRDVPSFLELKNSLNRAKWAWRWARQGGSFFTVARDLRDLRNAEDLKRWREIEFERSRLGKKVRKVVNIAACKINRARRRSA